ncbi:MAG: hypothetical protein JSR67_13365 [Proteobacteria bacterium]|nr:hypothetical protein [Pseudomonadota bacterium]
MSLRWALLLLSVLILAGLTWWEMRRRAAGGGSVLAREAARSPREPQPHEDMEPAPEFAHLPAIRAREPLVTRELPVLEIGSANERVPVLEPSVQSTQWYEPEIPRATAAQDQEHATAGVADVSAPTVVAVPGLAPAPAPAPALSDSEVDTTPALPADALEPRVEWPAEDRRRIVAVRLLAPPHERFAGRPLRQALAAEGFVLGRFDIFHKPDEERRAVLSAASLNRPGTFDLQTMDSLHFGGLSLFAVLPGPKPLPQAFEELVDTARNLSQRLNGVLQDELGSPLTAARVALLRERLGAGTAP